MYVQQVDNKFGVELEPEVRLIAQQGETTLDALVGQQASKPISK